MATQMLIRMDPELKDRLSRLARAEGTTTSQMVRGLIEDYVKERDISGYIDDLWSRIGDKLRDKGVTPGSIEEAVKEVRKNRP
ncbi:MAG: ribbon-helix-helix protein, CopG family [Thermodesulfobacteriota bacterium]